MGQASPVPSMPAAPSDRGVLARQGDRALPSLWPNGRRSPSLQHSRGINLSGEAMRPFNADVACPKCGNAEVLTVYEEAVEEGWIHDRPNKEHLLRTCQRCHYKWREDCLPQEKR